MKNHFSFATLIDCPSAADNGIHSALVSYHPANHDVHPRSTALQGAAVCGPKSYPKPNKLVPRAFSERLAADFASGLSDNVDCDEFMGRRDAPNAHEPVADERPDRLSEIVPRGPRHTDIRGRCGRLAVPVRAEELAALVARLLHAARPLGERCPGLRLDHGFVLR